MQALCMLRRWFCLSVYPAYWCLLCQNGWTDRVGFIFFLERRLPPTESARNQGTSSTTLPHAWDSAGLCFFFNNPVKPGQLSMIMSARFRLQHWPSTMQTGRHLPPFRKVSLLVVGILKWYGTSRGFSATVHFLSFLGRHKSCLFWYIDKG